jgi:hypothetical protein
MMLVSVSLGQHRCDGRDERRVGELGARDVDGHVQAPVGSLVPPAGGLGARQGQHPRAERDDQAGLLGHVDEGARCQQPADRMLPARQRLKADDAAAGAVDDGLVERADQAVVDRMS